MAYKRYRSVFSESSAVSSNSKLKMKERIRRILNEKELSKKDVESIVSKIETVITDVISGYGVDNSIVDELSGTVKNINAFASTMISQNDVMEEIQGMEESFRNKNRKIKENYMDMDMSTMEMPQDSFYDEMSVEDSFEDDVFADEYSMYENRLSKINKLKRKLREGLDEEEDMAEGEDMEEDMEEADDMEEGEEDIEEADMSAYEEEDEEEDDEEEEKKESRFRRRNFRYSEEESEHGDDLIPSHEGSDYDFLSDVDDMGNAASDRGMEASYDSNKGM